jgi:hypothetical protein
MSCRAIEDRLSSFLEGDLPGTKMKELNLHVARCRDCSAKLTEASHSRARLLTALRALPAKPAPKELASRLRVLASHEFERIQGRGDFSSATRRWWMRARISMRDLMRPLALPAAGGVLSSVACFTMLASCLSFPQQFPNDDIPLGFTTQVQVDQLSPFGYTGHDVVMELTIDKNGQVADYAARGLVTRDDMKQLGNLILFTSFAPATAFGQRTSGKILLRSHRINVRG